MRINEVEGLVGITKKNIRFYEAQGLLTPKRNTENGYRDYTREDVLELYRIKLLRKLGVPIEDIRHMMDGVHTVGDGMRRHLVTLERERRNIDQSILLCSELQSSEIPLSELDAQAILERMDRLEKGGTSFRDSQSSDVRVRYAVPVVIAVLTAAVMAGLCILTLLAYRIENGPPFWVCLLLAAVFAAIGAGAILALVQRIREIVEGEMDDARKY